MTPKIVLRMLQAVLQGKKHELHHVAIDKS